MISIDAVLVSLLSAILVALVGQSTILWYRQGKLTGTIEAGLRGIEQRLSAVETRMTRLEDAVETRMTRLEERFSAVQGQIAELSIHTAKVSERVAGLELRMARLEKQVADLADHRP